MCRRYKFVWQCGCEQKNEKYSVICCPTSNYFNNRNTPSGFPKFGWIEASQTEIDSQHLEYFGSTWEKPIKLEIKRICYKCPIPPDTIDDFPTIWFDMPYRFGIKRCVEILMTDDVWRSARNYPSISRELKRIRWRSNYERLRRFGALSLEDLEWLNIFLDSIEKFLKRAEETEIHFMTHSGQNFTEEVSSQLKQVRKFQIFLKSKVALNVLLAKDDESRVKPKLLRSPRDSQGRRPRMFRLPGSFRRKE